MSNKKQELRTFSDHMGSPPFLVESVLLMFFVFCVVYFVFLGFVLCLVPRVARVSGLSTSSTNMIKQELYDGQFQQQHSLID